MEQKISNLLGIFDSSDKSKIIAFLNEGKFCENGRIAFIGLFVAAQKAGLLIDKVLLVCQEENKKSWCLQAPQIRADIYISSTNLIRLQNIYICLGLKLPMAILKEYITKKIVVITNNSTYKLTGADDNGTRGIVKIGGGLFFKTCQIKKLIVGCPLVAMIGDGSKKEETWYTSIVCAINMEE